MERNKVDELTQIEQIKQLKSRYCRYIDTKQWSALRALFADDARFEGFASAPAGSGPETFVEVVSKRLKDAVTVHQAHMPDIELIGANSARGVWAMSDYLEWPAKVKLADGSEAKGYYGFGHYEEEYRKQGDAWKMQSLRLTRLRIVPLRDDHPPLGALPGKPGVTFPDDEDAGDGSDDWPD